MKINALSAITNSESSFRLKWEVANAIGMNQSNYSKIEKGDQEPNLQQLKGICEYLHLDANYLLSINGDNLSCKDALLLSEIKCLIEKYGKK